MTQKIQIASWNINSIRARIELVEKFLIEYQPDILCLQETKVVDDLFPSAPFRMLGYNHQALHGQPMHHGVAILSKLPLRDIRRHDWQQNGEARHVGASLANGMRVENVYVPAGGDIPDAEENPKFGQKLNFINQMIAWSQDVETPTILTGDFNIAPLEHDVWSHKQLANVVSHTQIEIDLLNKLQGTGNWVDLARHFTPAEEKLYTWWSYRARDYAASNRGRRLDHMWVTPNLLEKAASHQVHVTCRGWAKPSDHVPIVTTFSL
ncbi:exodeoxyribonuclease III [Sphingorhabdus lutea]|uniref:Exodeoxyribonuclease III n=1 Tax=Sphingorhabdus lutea TaxID=1913578 RepID=A0A1L3JDP2_9SPHN|nr:exodeoxyribonuclease III [Sphingorhabdus lutea]APG63258.1 exodeoxyribonuclease III [Sphingorhabdus lutea]